MNKMTPRIAGGVIALLALMGITILSIRTLSENAASPQAGIVFVVVAIDTEPDGFYLHQYRSPVFWACFGKEGKDARIAQAMDEHWRNSWRDSFDDPLKLTWFVMTHEAFCHSPNGSVTAVLDSLMTFSEPIKQFGDEIGWHHHHADWLDSDGDGSYLWSQIVSFDGTRYTHGTDVEIAERMLNHLLVDRRFFASAFRSGWLWENNGFSNWLEEIVPFDYSALPGMSSNPKKTDLDQARFDWSRCPDRFSGYHPHCQDYQTEGNMTRWVFRSIHPDSSVAGDEFDRVLNAAKAGGNQLVCLATHSYNNICRFVDSRVGELLIRTDSAGIKVRFATATDAAATLSALPQPPESKLEIESYHDSLVITASHDLYQQAPYCVVQHGSGSCERVVPKVRGLRQWSCHLPESALTFVCGACDVSGISVVAAYEVR